VIFDALPDIDGFYRERLKVPLPQELEFADKSLDVVHEWVAGEKR